MNVKPSKMRTLKCNLGLVMLSLATLTATSCKDTKKEDPVQEEIRTDVQNNAEMEKESGDMALNVQFKDDETAALFQHYLQIKNALVKSDAKAVSGAAQQLVNAVKSYPDVRTTAEAIAEGEPLERQREFFSTLTTLMEDLLKGGITSGEIYKQYCPMAFKNTGAYWFSESKEIRNPYFGDKMLTCGSVEETIKKD